MCNSTDLKLKAFLIHFQDSFSPAYADFIFIYSKIVKK